VRLTLKNARKQSGKTQKEIAAAIGISERMYQDIEAARREGKGYIWDRLQSIFGLDQKDLRKVTFTKEAVWQDGQGGTTGNRHRK
jgi:transcriptional regulator with XRE-family HTH domain